MHQIEYDGANPASPWRVSTDDGQEWHTKTEEEAALSLAAYILSRDGQAQPEAEPLPEGLIYI